VPQGTGPGQLNLPEGIAIDSHDNIYVSDELGNRVQKFTADGRLLFVWGANAQGADVRLDYPRGLAVDSAGNIYVTNLIHGLVQKLAPDGSQVEVFTLPGFFSSKTSAFSWRRASRQLASRRRSLAATCLLMPRPRHEWSRVLRASRQLP
jgi:DNA-binding beta-propeller fold protein YncE